MRSVLAVFGSIGLLISVVTVVLAEDTPEAAAMRKVLQEKVKEVKYNEQRIEEVMDDLKETVKGFKYKLDSKGGVSRNSKISYTGKDKTVAEILDGLFIKSGLGYYVISNKKDSQFNGAILIKQGKERGYPAGEEPKDK